MCGSLHPPSHQNSSLGQAHTSLKSKLSLLGNEGCEILGPSGSGIESDFPKATGPNSFTVSAGKFLKHRPTSHGLSFIKGLYSEAVAYRPGKGSKVGLTNNNGPEVINGQGLDAGHVIINGQGLGNNKGPLVINGPDNLNGLGLNGTTFQPRQCTDKGKNLIADLINEVAPLVFNGLGLGGNNCNGMDNLVQVQREEDDCTGYCSEIEMRTREKM